MNFYDDPYDTVGCNHVEVLSTPYWRESSTTYSRQYEIPFLCRKQTWP